MADVFISYKREDHARAAPLAALLEARGYTVWWDVRLRLGEQWSRRIKAELDDAKCVVVLWTTASVGEDHSYISDWVSAEADWGFDRGVLIPVLLDAGRLVWNQRLQHCDLTNWAGDEAHPSLLNLYADVARLAGERTKPPLDEVSAWAVARADETVESLSSFLRDFPDSRFALGATVLLAGAKRRVREEQLQSLLDETSPRLWAENATRVLDAVNDALGEALEDAEGECADIGTEDGPSKDRLRELARELEELSAAAEAADSIRWRREQIDRLLGEIEHGLAHWDDRATDDEEEEEEQEEEEEVEEED